MEKIQKQSQQYDTLYKFIIIGNTSCGKTCILHHFIEGEFKKNSTYTIGVEFGSKILSLQNKNIKLQIWDTAGQERFKSVARTYYRGALGAIIVYDMTRIDTFHSVKQWIQDARDLARNDIQIAVFGNKCDLLEERQVTYQEAKRFCDENNVLFYETSANTGDNVEQGFVQVTKQIMDMVEKGIIDNNELKPKLEFNINTKASQQQNQNVNGQYCQC
ncbi:ras oncogene family protein, putative [Ichthyophthirius multifiliis]|uniref:Ras oncogene family protein, putative n=1 Tax=Ichthyophthirius multifiliis TaxID=5932 RepID=G0R473_ICHMU|nr:ras oncogene family protein, putative [Ichthyophthirius multifiliis]EGR27744.1 ras oncogene family protein, putative [Ichthyophthirius multifiliis]|eukprot:XP_004025196.1 ras oncogene family protein, putative [Ichthyophthirius multifiliis]